MALTDEATRRRVEIELAIVRGDNRHPAVLAQAISSLVEPWIAAAREMAPEGCSAETGLDHCPIKNPRP